MRMRDDSSLMFVRGAARLAGMLHPQKISSVGEIIWLNEGLKQYDLQPGFIEMGVTQSGFQISRDEPESFMIAEVGDFVTISGPWRFRAQIAGLPEEWMERAKPLGPKPTIIVMTQQPDQSIRVWIFRDCIRIPVDIPIDFRKMGEASAFPVEFVFTEFQMIDELPIKGPRTPQPVVYHDFETWRASLDG